MTSVTAASESPAERYLRDWHYRHPDASQVFVGGRDDAGQSSYQHLAALALNSTAVLDAACGPGALLSIVRTIAPMAQLTGVDLSQFEVRQAAHRCPTSRLCVARGQSLPLATGSFDLVLCHMALMLMDRPEDVLLEIRRVLRAGGRFSAVTNRPLAPAPMTKAILGALRPAWNRSNTSLHPPSLGDSRTYEPDALLSLVDACFKEAEIEQFVVVEHVKRRDLWPYLVNSIYGLDAIADHEARAILDGLDLPELVPWTVPMVQVHARV